MPYITLMTDPGQTVHFKFMIIVYSTISPENKYYTGLKFTNVFLMNEKCSPSLTHAFLNIYATDCVKRRKKISLLALLVG